VAYAIPSNAIMQGTFRGQLFNQTVMNIFHWRWEQGATPIADGNAFYTAFHSELVAAGLPALYAAMLPPEVISIKLDLQWISPLRYRKVTFDSTSPGNAGFDTTVTNLQSALQFNGDRSGPRYTGVKKIPGLGGTAVDEGLLTPDVTGPLHDFAEQYKLGVGITAGFMRAVVYGRARAAYTDCKGVEHPALPEQSIPITGYSIGETARVIRRRTVGLGI